MEIAQCQTYFKKKAEWNESYSSMTRPQTAILEGGEIELDAEISELNIFFFSRPDDDNNMLQPIQLIPLIHSYAANEKRFFNSLMQMIELLKQVT